MGATAEGLAWTVRFGDRHHALGDPFDGTCVVSSLGNGGALISALLDRDEFTADDRDAILELCARLGFDHAKMKRVDPETKRARWFVYDLTARPFKRRSA
jgi:hypothetical protein